MYYSIVGLSPRTDIDIGRHGFCIYLHDKFKWLVSIGNIDQSCVNHVIEQLGIEWLNACGYQNYKPRDIRVSWGEWGPEHITVPGNACGLDIDHCALGNPLGGPALYPHNIDSWSQKQLLLIVFCYLVESLTINGWVKINGT